MRTLGDYAGAANGFDTIRLGAATAVIVSHAFALHGLAQPLSHWIGGQTDLGRLAVATFFAISGFLIPASWDRSSGLAFTVKRIRRIVPALAVAVAVCAFVLGPAQTTLPLTRYLTDPALWRFVGNALFLPVGYDLPGVFADLPVTAVNGSLWSLKFEVACYAIVPAVLIWRRLCMVLAVAGWLASLGIVTIGGPEAVGAYWYLWQLAELYLFFGAGVMLYLLQHRVPVGRSLVLLAALATLAVSRTPAFLPFASIVGSYAVIAFAYLAPRWFRDLTARGDISYGVYV